MAYVWWPSRDGSCRSCCLAVLPSLEVVIQLFSCFVRPSVRATSVRLFRWVDGELFRFSLLPSGLTCPCLLRSARFWTRSFCPGTIFASVQTSGRTGRTVTSCILLDCTTVHSRRRPIAADPRWCGPRRAHAVGHKMRLIIKLAPLTGMMSLWQRTTTMRVLTAQTKMTPQRRLTPSRQMMIRERPQHASPLPPPISNITHHIQHTAGT
jgi:hypothetical protein